MAIGTVKRFTSRKGHGFIQPYDGSTDRFAQILAAEPWGTGYPIEGENAGNGKSFAVTRKAK